MSPRPVARGALLGRGGEGNVYEIPDQPQLAAKIYHNPPSPERIAKLQAMVAMRDERLSELTAWPVRLLRSRGGGTVRGFAMPRVTGYQAIHQLYSPKSRAAVFPEANFRFLVHAGMNLARAVDQVHARGCVIGDVNYANVMVSSKAMVRLIDCDSFQVRDGVGRVFRCEVGEPTFVPPELQGRELRTVDRSVNHDAFGLAVLIFHLLFQGRHPFAGRFLGPGDMGIEQAIREHRFVYGRTGRAMQMDAPPHTLRLAALTPEIACLFERAFAPDNAGGGHRPTAAEWNTAIEGLGRRLAGCAKNPAHFFVKARGDCPWCAIETATGYVLFRTKLAINPLPPDANLATLWAAIESISPPPAAILPDFHSRPMPSPTPEALAAAQKKASLIYRFSAPRRAELRFFQEQERTAMEHYKALEHRWSEMADDKRFHNKRSELHGIRLELSRLPRYRDEQLTKLQATRQEVQLRAYLEQFEIAKSTIDGIGASRKATLLSYGIETAADVTRTALSGVPGFGEVLSRRLLQWRAAQEKRFCFDPGKGIGPKEAEAVMRDVLSRQAQLEARLRAGRDELSRTAADIQQRRRLLEQQLETAARELRQAQANLSAVH